MWPPGVDGGGTVAGGRCCLGHVAVAPSSGPSRSSRGVGLDDGRPGLPAATSPSRRVGAAVMTPSKRSSGPITPRCASPILPPSATMTDRRGRVAISALSVGLGQVHVRDAVPTSTPVQPMNAMSAVMPSRTRRRQRVDERVLQRTQRAAGDDHGEPRHRLLERQRDVEAVGDDDDPVRSARSSEGLGDLRGRGADVEHDALARRARARRPRRRWRRLASTPTVALSFERALDRADCSTDMAPPWTRETRRRRASASKSLRIVTSDVPSSRASSVVRAKPRASTTVDDAVAAPRRGTAPATGGEVGRRSIRPVSYTFICFRNCKSRSRCPRAEGGAMIHRQARDRRSPTAASSSTSTTPTRTLSRRARASTPARSTRGPRPRRCGRTCSPASGSRSRPPRQNRVFLPPGRARPARAGSPRRTRPRSRRLRRRRVREPLAVVRPAAASADDAPTRPRRPRRDRPRPHPHAASAAARSSASAPRPHGSFAQPLRVARPHRHRGLGRPHRGARRPCPASSRCSRSRTAARRSA